MSDTTIRFEFKLILLSCFTLFLSLLDVNIVNVSYPVLAKVFDVNISGIVIVSMSFLFTLSIGLPLAGRVNDIVGAKRNILFGYFILIVAGIFCSLSDSVEELAIFRALQGIGAAFLSISSTSLLIVFIPPQRRGRAFGYMATSGALGLTLGSSIGGLLSGYFVWQSIFFAILPIAALIMFLYYIYLPAEEESFSFKDLIEKFDFKGFFLICLGLGLFLFAMESLIREDQFQSYYIALSVIGIFIIYMFIRYELKISAPLIDLSVFSNIYFFVILIANMLAVIVLSMNNFIIPFYLMQILKLSPQHTGLMMVLFSVSYGFFSIFSGKLSDTANPYLLCLMGMFVAIAISLIFYFTLDMDSFYIVGAFLFLNGFAYAFFLAPANTIALSIATGKNAGSTTAIFRSTRQISSLLGVVTIGLLTHHVTSTISIEDFRTIFLTETLIAFMSLLLVLYLVVRRKQ